MLWKWSSPHYFFELVICIILRHWLWQMLCALIKNGYLRRCTISRDVSCTAMDTIFRRKYRALRWLLLSRVVSCTATDAWTDMSLMGPRLRDSGCVSLGQTCIIIIDIALHILIISELHIVFCWSCDCLSAELVIVEYWACYWGYIICWSVVVEDMKFLEVLLLRIYNLLKCCCGGYIIRLSVVVELRVM